MAQDKVLKLSVWPHWWITKHVGFGIHWLHKTDNCV